MACHAFRRGGLSQLYDDAANAGHKNPLRLAMTAADHRSEAQTESYLDKSRDRRDLADMLHQMYGEQQPDTQPQPAAAEPKQPVQPAEQTAQVVSWPTGARAPGSAQT
jgi:hypothetical protein